MIKAHKRIFFVLLVFSFFAKALRTANFIPIPFTNTPPISRLYHTMDYNQATNSLVIFGGSQDITSMFNDVWSFDLSLMTYTNLVPTTSSAPCKLYLVARIKSGSFIDFKKNNFYVFGGNTKNGPQNDLWCFDLLALKWTLVLTTGNIPSVRFNFGYTKFYEKSSLKFVIFGGSLSSGESNEMFLYDVDTFNWQKLNATGKLPPKLAGSTIQFYNGSIYVVGGEVSSATDLEIIYFNGCYQLNLSTLIWSQINLTNTYVSRYLAGSGIMGNELVLLNGWSNFFVSDVQNLVKLNLDNPIEWQNATVDNSCAALDSFSFATVNNSIYMFGGFYLSGYINNLTKLENGKCSIINDNILSPPARMFHSLVVINGNIYLFGGRGLTENLDDLWSFSDTTGWVSYQIEGDSPSARSSYGCAAEGDIMIIWGGESDSGYLNDMYMYEAASNKWESIQPTGTIPTARKGVCIVLNLPVVYIFGGSTSSGVVRELWEYNTATNVYTQLYGNNDIYNEVVPDQVSYPTCYFSNNSIIVMFGVGSSDTPMGSVYSYSLETKKWSSLYTADTIEFKKSLAVTLFKNNTIIVLGGEEWSTDPYKTCFTINLETKTGTIVAELPFYFYAGGFVIYNSVLYIHGGGSVIGNTMRTSVPMYSFHKINITSLSNRISLFCSPGSYGDSSNCFLCPPGYYSESFNQNRCTPCEPGYYNSIKGASSVRQCYPCGEGTYSDTNGSSNCYDCPTGKFCPVGSTNYNNDHYVLESISNQPISFKADSLSEKQNILYICVGTVFFSLILFMLLRKNNKSGNSKIEKNHIKSNSKYVVHEPLESHQEGEVLEDINSSIAKIDVSEEDYNKDLLDEDKTSKPKKKKSKDVFKKIDIYRNMHNYELNHPMYLKKTTLGGVFTVFFILTAILIISLSSFQYSLNNVSESKTLLPLVILEKMYPKIQSSISIQLQLINYGGTCTSNLIKQGTFNISLNNIEYDRYLQSCHSTENNCIIDFECKNCAIKSGATVAFVLQEKFSYCSEISVNVSANSSIPNQLSSVYENAASASNYVFRGFNPTLFNFMMTPSLFTSYVSQSYGNNTGYHVSVYSATELGSQYSINE